MTHPFLPKLVTHHDLMDFSCKELDEFMESIAMRQEDQEVISGVVEQLSYESFEYGRWWQKAYGDTMDVTKGRLTPAPKEFSPSE